MRYEAQDQVFVAMPFTGSFQRTFETIIEPAIRSVNVGGRPLVPRIINRGTSGSPDIHEQIFDAILHSRLVVADLTVQASYQSDNGARRWQANSNVAYEVGLAAAWRNPEDILLIHQGHPDHQYSFDVQNLRHVQYDPMRPSSAGELAREVVHAINQSRFLAEKSYLKILQSVSPSALQFMHQEVQRVFPVIAFKNSDMPIMDSRIHAATELLAVGALKNRNVFRQEPGKGVAVIYEWTELGLRMLVSLHAATAERAGELRSQTASVSVNEIPPPHLREFPEPTVKKSAAIDIVNAAHSEMADDQQASLTDDQQSKGASEELSLE